ncbi:hypothetical protein [Rhodopseudomonas palustris]|uniref:Uncharacterized protein n=1 Tax=Rhodopseudomonas palustris (strain BisB18) TaxID=316056 RepID=Q213V9_RHOPB
MTFSVVLVILAVMTAACVALLVYARIVDPTPEIKSGGNRNDQAAARTTASAASDRAPSAGYQVSPAMAAELKGTADDLRKAIESLTRSIERTESK